MRSTAGRITAAILLGGVVAGTLDIFVAALINGLSVGVILQAIASGLLGRASFFDGERSIVIGFVAQELMSVTIAAIFVLASLRLPVLRRRTLALGTLYGVAIFLVMNLVVVPLSAAFPKHRPINPEGFALNLAAMILFGLVVAYSARAVLRSDNSPSTPK